MGAFKEELTSVNEQLLLSDIRVKQLESEVSILKDENTRLEGNCIRKEDMLKI
jgi:uncharacterized small protein (DUF1192 family)